MSRESSKFEQILVDYSFIIMMTFGVFLVFIGITLSPELLIKLGPLRGSLTHEMELVRKSTAFEVDIIKYTSLVLGMIILLAIPFRAKISSSNLANRIRESKLPDAPFNNLGEILGSWSFKIMIPTIFFLTILFLKGSSFFSSKFMSVVFKEDGVVEYGTAFMFLIASYYSLRASIVIKPLSRKVISIILVLGYFLCFGEEISWGQRIFMFETPESIARVNIQKEMNLHNLLGYFADHVFIFGVFLGGFVLPFISSFLPTLRRICYYFGIPLASGGLAIGFFIASLFHNWTLGNPGGDLGLRPAEIREFYSALGFIIIMYEHYRNG